MSERAEIDGVIQAYLDGLYEGDTAKWAAIFDPVCHFHYVVDGKLMAEPIAAVIERVKARPSPKSQGLARHDWVHMVDQSGPGTALVKIGCAIPPRFFTDYLTLLKLDSGWRIVTKTFRMEMR